MGPDPETTADLLYTINYYSNELVRHFKDKKDFKLLQDKANNIKVDDYPL